MAWLLTILKVENIKIYLIVIGVIAAVWLYKDVQNTKQENIRIKENASQLRKMDSIGYSQQILTKNELIEDLKYNRQDLLKRLEDQDIALKRIQKLITVRNQYQDTVNRSYVLDRIVEAIEKKEPVKQSFVDSTSCHIVKGNIEYDGQEISVNITNRQFSDITDIVASVEKVGLRFWKWFRKKKVTVTVINSCGQTQTEIIKVKK